MILEDLVLVEGVMAAEQADNNSVDSAFFACNSAGGKKKSGYRRRRQAPRCAVGSLLPLTIASVALGSLTFCWN